MAAAGSGMGAAGAGAGSAGALAGGPMITRRPGGSSAKRPGMGKIGLDKGGLGKVGLGFAPAGAGWKLVRGARSIGASRSERNAGRRFAG